MSGSHKLPKTVIIGRGRLGGALAIGLRRARWPVSVLPGHAFFRRLPSRRVPIDRQRLKDTELCLIAVPDHAIRNVAQEIARHVQPTTALVHCAGALTLSAFGARQRLLHHPRGSFHVLCAVSNPRDDLVGHAVALAATTPALLRTLKRMAKNLGLVPFQVPEAKRGLYHAGAVLGAAGLVALASGATEALVRVGLPHKKALGALLALMRSAVRGVERLGLSKGLTGPIPRGDLDVVKAHLAALPSHLLPLYCSLSLRSLELAGSLLPRVTLRRLQTMLTASLDRTTSVRH